MFKTSAVLLVLMSAVAAAATSTQPAATLPSPPPVYTSLIVPLIHRSEIAFRAPVPTSTADQTSTILEQRMRDVGKTLASCAGKKATVLFVVDSVASGSAEDFTISGHIPWTDDVQLTQKEKDEIEDINKTTDASVQTIRSRMVTRNPIHSASLVKAASGGDTKQNVVNQNKIDTLEASRRDKIKEIHTNAASLRPLQSVIIKTNDHAVADWEGGQAHTIKGAIVSVNFDLYSASSGDIIRRKTDSKPPIIIIKIDKPTIIAIEEVQNPAEVYIGTRTTIGASAEPATQPLVQK